MNPELWYRVAEIFHEALERPVDERQRYVQLACGSDVALRDVVIPLVMNYQDSDDILDHPIMLPHGLAPGDFLLGRYRIEELIGRGGMGEVYSARDTLIDERIALKTLRPELHDDTKFVRRLMREVQLARKVTHPNVCRVFDAGMHRDRFGAELDFLTMELLQGETLAARIARTGGLPSDEALRIAVEMAAGLHAAHQAGVVHRDFKSSNVMLCDGHAVITDFGLARIAVIPSGGDAAGSLPGTTTQLAGTIAYMSPEQLSGDEVTTASDIYSFGIVLFEMTTGRLPFDDTHIIQSAMQRVVAQAPDIRSLAPELRPQWAAVITECLHRDPHCRPASAQLVADQLRPHRRSLIALYAWPHRYFRRRTTAVAFMGLIVMAAVAVTLVPVSWTLSAPIASVPSVAVLPFLGDGHSPDLRYYKEGLAYDLISHISRQQSVRVVSWMSVRKYVNPDREVMLAAIGKTLNVAAIVTGTVYLDGEHITVKVELVECASGLSLWTGQFDGRRQETPAIQNQIIGQLSQALAKQPVQAMDPRAVDYRVYDLYLRGRVYSDRPTADNLRLSVQAFTDAIALLPTYAPAYAGLADAYSAEGFYQFERPDRIHPLAEAAAREALQLDGDLPEAHAALGSLYLDQLRWHDADTSLARAVALNPSLASAHHSYSLLFTQQGRFDRARDEIRAAQLAAPGSDLILAASAYIHYASHNFTAAIEQYQLFLDTWGKEAPASVHVGLIDTYAASGRLIDARRSLVETRQLLGSSTELDVPEAYVTALEGDTEGAASLLARLEADQTRPGLSYTELAGIYSILGDFTRAFGCLGSAIDAHEPLLGYLLVDPRYDALRRDTRFTPLVAQLGLTIR